MNKDEVEFARIYASAQKFDAVCGLIKHLISVCGGVFAIYLIFKGLVPFLTANPDVISAMALVIEKINVANVTGYIVGAGAVTAWAVERQGKKRAIKEKGRLQKLIESTDNYRSSSNLTQTGDTPDR